MHTKYNRAEHSSWVSGLHDARQLRMLQARCPPPRNVSASCSGVPDQRCSCCWVTQLPDRDPGVLSPNHLVCKSHAAVGCSVCKVLSELVLRERLESGVGGTEVLFGVAAPATNAMRCHGAAPTVRPTCGDGKGDDYPIPGSNGPTLCNLSTRVVLSGSRRKGARST